MGKGAHGETSLVGVLLVGVRPTWVSEYVLVGVFARCVRPAWIFVYAFVGVFAGVQLFTYSEQNHEPKIFRSAFI
jgi:hypothetical protein